MKYSDLVTLLSEARMSKYNRVTHGDKMKTIQFIIITSNLANVYLASLGCLKWHCAMP